MSQSKKRKKKGICRKPPKSYLTISRQYAEDYVRVAHKMMKLAGIDPAEFDVLTKRTKQEMMKIRITPYHIQAEKNSTVPRVYIRLFNHVMGAYEKRTYYGDPKFNITFLEYVTFGMSFIFSVTNHNDCDRIISDDQHRQLEKIKEYLEKLDDDYEDDHFLIRTNQIMRNLSMYVSTPNYRYYTSKLDGEVDYQRCRMENQIKVSSFEPEKKYFKVNGEKHSSYQLWHYDLVSEIKEPNPEKTEIPAVLLEAEDINSAIALIEKMDTIDRLPVYVQNHTLHRIRQRLDCLDNLYINTVISISVMLPHFITATNGQRLLSAMDSSGKPIGYFPFLKQDEAILLLSFLPLSSPITPEGSVLYKELGIQMEDSKYIGLDKLSFYKKTDFDTVPKLKQALEKANMWHLTELITIDKSERKEDQILKRMFVETTQESE